MDRSPLVLSTLVNPVGAVEIVERKGIGHPDTLCDALAENLARTLSRYYREHFGQIFHHNVDKALLCGGRSVPRFTGGEVLSPIEIYLAGRAVDQVAGRRIPLEELAIEGSKAWLRENMRYLDVEKHVRIHCKVRPGSAELVDTFSDRAQGMPLANDTSIGVGYAPLSETERLVHAIDRERVRRPAHGEDTKIMAVRSGNQLGVTLACAMVDTHIANLDAYLSEKQVLVDDVGRIVTDSDFSNFNVAVNTADEPENDRLFLTVTGTSAEAGDDGQVGRGNRINGLITPYRPMSLEAAAGKNCITHVGKLYNVAAAHISAALIEQIDVVGAAQCVMVSQIGQPLDRPAIVDIKVETKDSSPASLLYERATAIVDAELKQLPMIADNFIDGEIPLY